MILHIARQTESDNIKEVVNQVTIQVPNNSYVGTERCGGRTLPDHFNESKRATETEDSGPVLAKPAFTWGTKCRYIGFMNFEMEVSNILESKVYELSEEKKSSDKTGWARRVCS